MHHTWLLLIALALSDVNSELVLELIQFLGSISFSKLELLFTRIKVLHSIHYHLQILTCSNFLHYHHSLHHSSFFYSLILLPITLLSQNPILIHILHYRSLHLTDLGLAVILKLALFIQFKVHYSLALQ